MATKSTTTIDVEIFGHVYHVRGEQDREHLERLATEVDRKMRAAGEHLSTVDSGKIAILAALNLADELDQCTKKQEGERDRIMNKVAELTAELTDALRA